MSRISPPGDRPIPTNEPKLATQQTSETESVQKTDTTGKTKLETEHVAKEPASTPEAKGAQFESQLGSLARQSELQSQFPITSSPTLKDLPDLHPNLDPNVHLNEMIDVTKNLPDGKSINKGLDGLDWGPSKAKTGPGHFGVEMTYGGMKAPTDVLSEVRNGGKPSGPDASGPPKDTRSTMTTADGPGKGNSFVERGHGNSTPPPGVELSSRAPKWDQVSDLGANIRRVVLATPDMVKGMAKDAAEGVKDAAMAVVDLVVDDAMGYGTEFVRAPETVQNVTGRSADLLDGAAAIKDGGVKKAKDLLVDDGKMTDPDAVGEVPISAEELARKIAVRGGATDPVRGSQGPLIEVDKPPVRYGDLVTDPGDTSEAVDGKSTSGNVLIGGGYTDGANRKDIPFGPPPGGGGGTNEGDI